MINIAPLENKNKDEWRRLYHGYAEYYNVPMNDEILDNVWSWIFDDNNPFYCLFATDETGKGFGLMHYRKMHSPLRGKMVGFLDDLFIDPDCRGANLAAQLFDALKKEAIRLELPIVRWITADNNYRARGVYDKLSTRTAWVTYQMDI